MDLFKNKTFENIELIFENCESYTLPAECIDSCYIEDIKCNLDLHYNGYKYACNPGEMMANYACEYFRLVINKKGMEINGDPNWQPQPLKDRIKFQDITHLNINFTDKTSLYVSIPWEDAPNDEYCNIYLKVIVKDEMICVYSIKNGEDEDESFEEYYEFETNCDKIPELGHMLFGNNQIYNKDVPKYVEAALQMIKNKLSTIMWNINQEEYESPFDNTGNTFKGNNFIVEAYDWNEESNQEYNFKWKDYKISWYKYFGRDMSANREMSSNECAEMLDDCLLELYKMEVDD